MRTTRRSWRAPRLVAAGVLGFLLLALFLFRQLMHPPASDFVALTAFLSAVSVIALASGYGAHRSGLFNRSPRLGWALLGGYVLSNFFAFLSVWVMARLMFVSPHDLILASVLLLFASGIAVSLGYYLAASITERIVNLNEVAERIAEGHLDARVESDGQDEIAGLARTFNTMAAQLEAASDRQRELDTLRRNLVAWVGHDLRTPLASVRVIVEALADGVVEDPATIQRYLSTIKLDVGSLTGLIDDLFEMARIDAGGLQLNRELSSLADLISDTVGAFAVQAEQRGVALRSRVTPALDPVAMDARQVGRVLDNLISNALRHTSRGGTVSVEAHRSDTHVVVTVQDTGLGIPAEDLPHIFDQFYRGEKSRNRATGGAGLGLAIARGIIEAHGGEITAANGPEGGAQFQFTIPSS